MEAETHQKKGGKCLFILLAIIFVAVAITVTIVVIKVKKNNKTTSAVSPIPDYDEQENPWLFNGFL